jgi:hypothetical protein
VAINMTEPKLPSDELSSQIVDALIASGLLRDDSRSAVAVKLANGTMSGPDWKDEIALAVSEAEKG